MFPCATLTLEGGKAAFTFSVSFPEVKKKKKINVKHQCKNCRLCHLKRKD